MEDLHNFLKHVKTSLFETGLFHRADSITPVQNESGCHGNAPTDQARLQTIK